MKLKKLFRKIPHEKIFGSREVEITGVCSNSKLVSPGNLFIARKGLSSDGTKYINEALSAGAVAVATDLLDPTLSIPQVICQDVAKVEGIVADTYYESPSNQLFMVGITGTNGKTTTSFLLKHFLESTFGPSGLLGTIEYILGRRRYRATHTTPDVSTNHKLLREMVLQGCKAGVMEVTSHALIQNRVDLIDYDVALFTNLTQDHLDYHKTMEAYGEAKSLLFSSLTPSNPKKSFKRFAIGNLDSPWIEKIVHKTTLPIHTFSLETPSPLQATDLLFSPTETHFTLHFEGTVRRVTSPLTGRFNVYNVLAALGVLLYQGIPLDDLLQLLSQFSGIPGRLEQIKNNLGIQIYVDYAHTEDALKNVLKTLREFTPGKIFTVFGCGGNRDPLKRPLMAQAVEQESDMAIVTLDNSRNEDPEAICRDILKGFQKHDKYIVELDRTLAIQKAISYAKPGDTVLIAGKGHETAQIFATQTIEFDDRKIAFEACLAKEGLK